MNVQELYQKKLTTAAEAVKAVKSGDWGDYGWGRDQPYTLDKALAARQSELRDVKVRGGVTMWMPEICKAEDAGEHFTWHSWHCSGIDRKIIAKGMGYFSPMRYSELPRFYRGGQATAAGGRGSRSRRWISTATSAMRWPARIWRICSITPRRSSSRSTRICRGSMA